MAGDGIDNIGGDGEWSCGYRSAKWRNKGVLHPRESGIVLDGSDEDAYFNAVSALIRDSHTRFGLGKKAMEVASALSPEVAAYKFLNCFWNEAPVPL